MSETENEAPDAGAPQQSDLDFKINLLFPGVVVRKDLVKAVKGNAIVPSYVLEYLLGQYAASDDEATIQAGIDTVRKILAEHYVHRSESELVKSTIKERGRHRIIDKVTVTLNEKADVYEAEFANLGIRGVIVESADDQGAPQAPGRRRLVHLRHRVLPQRRPARRAVDPRLDQADPAVEVRLRAVPRGAPRVHHRRVDRPAHAVHRVQPRTVQPSRQVLPARAPDPVRRAQLQPRRARPEGHRQVAHLLRVLAARHADLRRRGHRPQALRQQLQRTHRPGRLLGRRRLRRVRGQEEAHRQGACRHHEELHGEQVVLPWCRDPRRRGLDGLRRQHLAHRAVHAQELRPVRRAARGLPRPGLPRPPAPLHPRLGSRHHPRRDVLRRLRVRRRLHRRGAQVDARRRTTPTATSSTSRSRPTSRPETATGSTRPSPA